jgi:transposase
MFARVKKSGKYQYLQIVQNHKEEGKVRQQVIATIGRLDELQAKGRVETLIRSLSRFSERALLLLSGGSDPNLSAVKIGPGMLFERVWQRTGIRDAIKKVLAGRKYGFDVERAIFMTVLHRLMASGSDRFCNLWQRDYAIDGAQAIELHHLYRAMAYLGEELTDQKDAITFTARCNKDLIEEIIFNYRRDLFSALDLVFFDTTSIYFEGQGGQSLGQRGFSKDHRPDLRQMVVGAIVDDKGQPVCCEMWPGNTADVTSLLPIIERLRNRFGIGRCCIVADRGMISDKTLKVLESPDSPVQYILGVRMRKFKAAVEVLSRAGNYREVNPEGSSSKDPSPLKVKEVVHNDVRYIVCVNSRQARKDVQDREAILSSLREQLKNGAKSLVGNKGYRRYLVVEKDAARIDEEKVKAEAKFDGKWVLRTNTDLPSDQVALKYKQLWQVERIFRDTKSLLETRPIFHQRDETIRGHVFCSFLALVLRKELDRCLDAAGERFEWAAIKQDLKALQLVTIEESGQRFAVRSQAQGVCGKLFKAVGVALPPTIKEI